MRGRWYWLILQYVFRLFLSGWVETETSKTLKPSRNDHHCSLTVPAVRHVWPLLEGSQQWRYDILSLLFEWSQRSISAKAMAEFAARYPQHLQMLIDIVAKEKKEDALPPGKGGTGNKTGWLEHHVASMFCNESEGVWGLGSRNSVSHWSLPFHTFLLCFFKFTMAIVPTTSLVLGPLEHIIF